MRFTETVEQSKAVDFIKGFHIVIAASGMCEAGRIRHRLKNWLWRTKPQSCLSDIRQRAHWGVFFEDGASMVRIQGDDIKVRARIRWLDIYSGHADGPELAEWVRARQPVRAGVFLVHGEDEGISGLRQRLLAFLPEHLITSPHLDAAFRLTSEGPVDISMRRSRHGSTQFG